MRPVSAAPMVCALISLSLITLTLGMAGCQPRTVTDTSRQIYCEVMPDAPLRDNNDNPTKVVSTVRFRCADPGAALTISVQLQKQNSNGDWVNLADKSFDATGAETVSTRDQTFRSWSVSATCSGGVFRTHIKGTSTARGNTKRYDRAGPRNFDPCRPGIFAAKN